MKFRSGLPLAISAICAASPAFAQVQGQELADLTVELGKFAVVVVVLESALSAVFTWRVYRAVFNHRALKMPIMFAVGLLVVIGFDYDVFAHVMKLAGTAGGSTWVTKVISALIVAGGSSGVNTLFQNLGLRSPLPEAPARPVLAQTEAWISVRVNGGAPSDIFQVAIKEVETNGPQLAGSVEVKPFGVRLREAWQSDARRFPNYGGWSVKAGQGYLIQVVDSRVENAEPKTVYQGSFAPRAIIDFQVKV